MYCHTRAYDFLGTRAVSINHALQFGLFFQEILYVSRFSVCLRIKEIKNNKIHFFFVYFVRSREWNRNVFFSFDYLGYDLKTPRVFRSKWKKQKNSPSHVGIIVASIRVYKTLNKRWETRRDVFDAQPSTWKNNVVDSSLLVPTCQPLRPRKSPYESRNRCASFALSLGFAHERFVGARTRFVYRTMLANRVRRRRSRGCAHGIMTNGSYVK